MIHKDMTIAQVMDNDRRLGAVLMMHGLMCFGCPSATRETLAEAAMVHGIDLDALLKDLNKTISEME